MNADFCKFRKTLHFTDEKHTKKSTDDVLCLRINGVYEFTCTKRSWIGFDLDGTLAKIEPINLKPPYPIGEPVPVVVNTLKHLNSLGVRCKLFTARAAFTNDFLSDSIQTVKNWLDKHNLSKYISAVTALKDPDMVLCIDDRSLRISNGLIQTGKSEPLVIEVI